MSDNVIYGLGGLMFFQAYVTVRIVRRKSYTSAQKRRQLLFVWLFPFVGAAIALAALATDDKNPARPD
jgi:hypothetical protein